MLIQFRVQIITRRGDGCFVDVNEQPDGMLHVSMVSQSGAPVTGDIIPKVELAQWINDHHDY